MEKRNRDIPTKTIEVYVENYGIEHHCPYCNKFICWHCGYRYKYCHNCGQALKYKEEIE